MTFVRSEGDYTIFSTRTGDYVVHDKNGKVVYITKGESSAINWCKRH